MVHRKIIRKLRVSDCPILPHSHLHDVHVRIYRHIYKKRKIEAPMRGKCALCRANEQPPEKESFPKPQVGGEGAGLSIIAPSLNFEIPKCVHLFLASTRAGETCTIYILLSSPANAEPCCCWLRKLLSPRGRNKKEGRLFIASPICSSVLVRPVSAASENKLRGDWDPGET